MRAIKLRTEHMKNPLGLDCASPYLSWKCSGGIRQTAYRILALSDDIVVWDSGKTVSSEMRCLFGGILKSRQRITWKICLWDEKDEVGEWSEAADFEMAFLEKDCWEAKWINPELELDAAKRQPASYLYKNFSVNKMEESRVISPV